MWQNDKTVNRTFSTYHGQNAWAIIDGVSGGWKKIKPDSGDGVTNVYLALCAARANGRRVDVFINSTSDQIEQVVLK